MKIFSRNDLKMKIENENSKWKLKMKVENAIENEIFNSWMKRSFILADFWSEILLKCDQKWKFLLKIPLKIS